MKAVLTTKKMPTYDDDPSVRYHFPRIYIRQIEQAIGDFIIYYEPRRTSSDPSSRGGSQSYFAVARLTAIRPDPQRSDHFYADLTDYIDFDRLVPFSRRITYFESALRKEDGSTNKGAFGRAVRQISDEEFENILGQGFSEGRSAGSDMAIPESTGFHELQTPFERPLIETIVTRPFRDRVFSRQVQAAYTQTCAVTGFRIINGGGRSEAQAAHIQPVAANGPDSVRNGLALSGTIHWMFDRGLISFDDDLRVLKAKRAIPEGIERLFHPTGMLLAPEEEHLRPHPQFLRYHRENIFKG